MRLLVSLAIVVLGSIGQVHATDVGRVLLAAGDAVAVRDQQVVRLELGSMVQDKDLLRTGALSTLQVRFIDESLLSMRENSELQVEEFRFGGREDGTERAFFRLLKGGLRKVTGLVGRINHANYRMGSTSGTIGIRGTDYATRLCQQDCFAPDGTLAQDGQYARVIGASSGTHRLTYTNETATQEFGIGENFYVADAKTQPQRLLVPPQLLGAVRGAAKPRAGTGKEVAAAGGVQHDPRGTTPLPPPPELPRFVATESRTAAGTPAVVDERAASVTGPVATPPVSPPVEPPPVIPLASGPGGLATTATAGGAFGGGLFGGTVTFAPSGALTRFDDCCTPGNNLSGVAAEFGADGIIAWGRWSSGLRGATPLAAMSYVANIPAHSVTATSIVRAYTSFASTAPVVTSGGAVVATGTPNSVTGTLSVNFPSMTGGGSLGYSLSVPVAAQTFSVNGSASQFSGVGFLGTSSTITSSGGACTPSCSGIIPFGNAIQGFFTGSAAERAGANYGFASGIGQVSGAVVFK